MSTCIEIKGLMDIQAENKLQYVTLGPESIRPTINQESSVNTDNDFVDDEPKQKLRKRNPENWKQNVRKRNKNKGLEYIKANGKICERKKLGPPCTCREKCYSKIGQEACEKIFNNFWKLGDHSLQNAYIAGCVRIFLPKHCHKKDGIPKRRFFSRNFYVTVNGVDMEVCKQAFLNVHAISNGRLDRLLKKKQEIGNTGVDERGRHNNKVNKIPLDKIRLVRKHIDSIREKAGYTGKRKPKKVEILSGTLNIRTMYRSYKEEMTAKGLEPVCEYRYRKIFHSDFHLDFGRVATPPGNRSSLNETVEKRDEKNEGGTEPLVSSETDRNDMKKSDALTEVTFVDSNLNETIGNNKKCTKSTVTFTSLEIPTGKEFQIRNVEPTSYVLSQEVFRLDYPTNYGGQQQGFGLPYKS